jgi:septal ring factor EnvC (AmiA/AmiB activator)
MKLTALGSDTDAAFIAKLKTAIAMGADTCENDVTALTLTKGANAVADVTVQYPVDATTATQDSAVHKAVAFMTKCLYMPDWVLPTQAHDASNTGAATPTLSKAAKLSAQLERVSQVRVTFYIISVRANRLTAIPLFFISHSQMKAEKEEIESAVNAKKAKIEEEKRAAAALVEELKEEKETVVEARRALREERKALDSEQKEFDSIKSKLESDRHKCDRDREKLNAQLDAAKATAASLETARKAVEKEAASLEKERERRETEAVKLEEQVRVNLYFRPYGQLC